MTEVSKVNVWQGQQAAHLLFWYSQKVSLAAWFRYRRLRKRQDKDVLRVYSFFLDT